MRAVVVKQPGPPDVLELVHDWPVPQLRDGEVLVRQSSTSVNPVDYKIREGAFKGKFPKVLGGDVSGIVEDSKAAEFQKGDQVIALTFGYHWDYNEYGSYADFTASKKEWLTKVTEKFPIEIGGGVPLVALTALQALQSGGAPKPGAHVLIQGGPGGVGHFAIQLAKVHFKAYVVATGGPSNQAFMKELGADETVDYKNEDFSVKYKDKPFDVIVDPIGGEVEKRCYTVLAPGGTYAHIFNEHTNTQNAEEAKKNWKDGRKYTLTLVQPNGEQLGLIARYMEAGKIRLVVEKEFPLEQIRDAHKEVEGGHVRGKVVVKVSA
ncbi:g7424 [Coccomyxa viridis]|uniref:G7424 protein n=1 Tax=Coccomyxa viridis TaxID=1274662 RepID=A0ABP1G4E1_9CHLO